METKSVMMARPDSGPSHEPERRALLGLENWARSCRAMLGAPSPGEFSFRTNPLRPLRESQRDSVTQPSGCRVGEATLGTSSQSLPTPTGLRYTIVIGDATPLGLKKNGNSFPRVARPSQPWANRRNPVGIRDDEQALARHDEPGAEGGSLLPSFALIHSPCRP